MNDQIQIVKISSQVAVNPKHVTFVGLGKDLTTGIYIIGMLKGFSSDFDYKTTIQLLNGKLTYEEAKARKKEMDS